MHLSVIEGKAELLYSFLRSSASSSDKIEAKRLYRELERATENTENNMDAVYTAAVYAFNKHVLTSPVFNYHEAQNASQY